MHFCNTLRIYGGIGVVLCLLALVWVAYISVLLKRARKCVGDLESSQTATFVEYVANVRAFRLNGWDGYMQVWLRLNLEP